METTIINYIQEQLFNNRSEIQLETDEDLLSTGLLDSISIMKLIEFIEKTYEVTIPPEDMTIDNFISVDAIVVYLGERKA